MVSEKWLVTVHTEGCPAFIDLRKRTMRGGPLASTAMLTQRVADSLTDSFYPELEQLDERVDALERLVLRSEESDVLAEVLNLRRRLVGMRRVLGPQRDLVARLAAGTLELPGSDDEVRLGFRATHDELIRVTELIDSQRDLLTGALEVHLATVSNTLNDVMRRLAAVSTVFLPITFLTGYFGQNFGYLVRHISGSQALLLGTLLQLRRRPRRRRAAARAPLDLGAWSQAAAWAWAGTASMNACASQQASALNASSSSSEESSAAVASRTLAPPVSTTSASGARSHSQAIMAGVSASRAAVSSQPAAMRTS